MEVIIAWVLGYGAMVLNTHHCQFFSPHFSRERDVYYSWHHVTTINFVCVLVV